jgi:hypothetical protein
MSKEKIHIIIIFAIVVVLIIIGVFGVRIFQPKSYGEHGHYRWDAVTEIQTQEIINQDIKTCGECHNDIYQLHEKDAHYNVPCVDCHGAGNLHVAYFRGGDSAKNITKEQAYLEKEYKLEGCLYCHRKLKAKPSDYPQINQEEHYKFLHVTDINTKCIECHSPHEPVFLLTEARQSRIHPIVYRCTECHDTKPEKNFRDVPNHPTIFECQDCHADIVIDFNNRPHHNYVECRTCHLFHKENETAGRIYKNGNAKFCLLCHEKKPFKDEKYPPKIEWPAHVGGAEIIKPGNEKICLNCHVDKIHKMPEKFRENPHPQNWRGEHKEFAKQNLNICQRCHTMNDCYSCHMKNKPASHTSEWKKIHPKSGLSNRQTCEVCHGKNSCISCHKLEMPHPKDWADNHKETVAKKGKEICNKCHNADFCKQCH